MACAIKTKYPIRLNFAAKGAGGHWKYKNFEGQSFKTEQIPIAIFFRKVEVSDGHFYFLLLGFLLSLNTYLVARYLIVYYLY